MRVPAPPIRVLSLFSGIGGLDLGLELACGARAVAYCEADPFCAAVLACRMADGALGPGPIWSDVRSLDGRRWRGIVDCVSGGSPCQDISVAGRGAGLEGERSGLWKHQRRIVEESEPAFVWWENVAGAVPSALPVIAGELEALGFRVGACLLRASDVGAPHRRERVFVLAYSERNALRIESERKQQFEAERRYAFTLDAGGELAHSAGDGSQGRGGRGLQRFQPSEGSGGMDDAASGRLSQRRGHDEAGHVLAEQQSLDTARDGVPDTDGLEARGAPSAKGHGLAGVEPRYDARNDVPNAYVEERARQRAELERRIASASHREGVADTDRDRLEGERRGGGERRAQPDADRRSGEELADSALDGRREGAGRSQRVTGHAAFSHEGERSMADTSGEGHAQRERQRSDARPELTTADRSSRRLLEHAFPPGPGDAAWQRAPWLDGPQPGIRRGTDGPSDSLEFAPLRLHALGNGVIPQQAALAFLICWQRLYGGRTT